MFDPAKVLLVTLADGNSHHDHFSGRVGEDAARLECRRARLV